MTTSTRSGRRPRQFDTSALKKTLIVSGVLATLMGGEMLANQESFVQADVPPIPTVAPIAQIPIDQMAWEIGQTPLTQLVVPDAVVSNIPIVDGQLLVGGEPMVELVIPDASQMAATAVNTDSLLDNAPIAELVIPDPVAVPVGSVSIGNAPLVGVVIGERGNNNGGGTTASIPAPTTTSQSSG